MATQYIVWVGGVDIGTYPEMDQAQEVYDDWRHDGYTDVEIEVVDHFGKKEVDKQDN